MQAQVWGPPRPGANTLRRDGRDLVASTAAGIPVHLVAFAVALLPLLRPKGPGHSAPIDIVMALAVLVTMMWASRNRIRIHLPYYVGVGVLVASGLLAGVAGVAPLPSLRVLVQDLFLLAWCGAVANVARTPANLSTLLKVWAWTALAWASVLVIAVSTGQWWLAGTELDGEVAVAGARAQLLFDNPNMASAYFVLSFFVIWLVLFPKNRVIRACALAIVLLALLYTGSNAALAALLFGSAATILVMLRRRAGVIATVGLGGIMVLSSIGAGYYVYTRDTVDSLLAADSSILESSVQRLPRSAERRSVLYSEQMELYRAASLLGIGPGTTKIHLGVSEAAIDKEAHSDYLATLVERGPLGVIGLVLLIGAIAVRAHSVSLKPLTPSFAKVFQDPAPFLGGVVAMAIFAITHETLHYRHLWAFLGLLAATYFYGLRRPLRQEEM